MDWDETATIFEHFKGGLYRMLFLARDSETQEPIVIYMHLDDGSMWTRRLSLWQEQVLWHDGVMRPRFRRVRAVDGVIERLVTRVL